MILKGRGGDEGNYSLLFNTVYIIIMPDVQEIKYGTPKINIMTYIYIYIYTYAA